MVEEFESFVETAEDTEALVAADRRPLTPDDWDRIERWLFRSRGDLLRALADMSDDRLEWTREGSSRTLREELVHVAFVELMYCAWTFDLRERAGVGDFLDWTRSIALARMRAVADADDGAVTYAEWKGAPRPEEWTARKAVRRLIWHELLHLRSLRGT